MKVLRFILQKEFKQIFRDKTILAMMLALPTIQLIVLPLAMNFDVNNVNLAVVDHDHSSYSQKLISKILVSAISTCIVCYYFLSVLKQRQAYQSLQEFVT